VKQLYVRNTVICWPENTMEITDPTGKRYVIPLDREIHVEMIGYPDLEQFTLRVRDLGDYMSRGYSVRRIGYEEGE